MGFFKDFKDDLAQAVDELTTDALDDELLEDETLVNTLDEELPDLDMPEDEEVETQEAPKAAKEVKAEQVKESNVSNTQAQVQEDDDEDDGSVSNETAVITKGLTIIGDMNSRGSIELLGSVEGNVTCRGKLTVSGSITGDARSMEVFANNARINGNVEATGSVKVGVGSVVTGNIVATSAVIAGAVKGNIDVHGPVIVDEGAIVVGDIMSRTVQINNGATIDGRCSQCYAEINYDDIFGKVTKKKSR